MPTTPTLLLPYPALTDPADVPADVKKLADRIEAVRGAATGLASLDASGLVPVSQLPASSASTYGTAFPASPANGDRHVLVDSTTNPTYQWEFRYNGGSTSPYKWEFVGGAPFVATVVADQAAPGQGGWTFPATTPGPDFVAPRAGDYDAKWACRASGAAAGLVNTGVANNSLGPTAIGMQATTQEAAAAAWYDQHAGHTRITGVASGQTLRVVIFTNIVSGAYGQRIITVTPVRLS